MSKLAIEKLATELSTLVSSYDKTKWNLGTLIKRNTGGGLLDNFISPLKVALARPMEESTAFVVMFPHVIDISATKQWVFAIENAYSATATRRVVAYEYNKTNQQYNYLGFITMTLQTATAHTQRGFRVARYLHTSGTVQATGTAVTGSSTQFNTERIALGARIGFGSTDPTQITQWYRISAIASDTGLTLATSVASAVSAGTPYVIEELRPMVVTTNATTTNGGLFVAKGITIDDFITTGTTISASASTVDNQKLVYWLADAGTITNTVGCGLMLDAETSKTTHYAYVLDGTTNVKVYRYNLRANDTIATGKMTLTGTNIVSTATQSVTGTNSQANNGRIATASHGAGSGIKSIYFVTTTRVYRADISNITNGNASWQSDNRVEASTGSSTTYPLTSALNTIEYMDSIDRFVITTTGATAFRNYITRYPATSGDPFDYIFGMDLKQIDQSTASADSYPVPVNSISLPFSVWSEAGITHIIRNGTTALNNHMYAVPFGAHADFADSTNQYAISPEFVLPNINKLLRVYADAIQYLGNNSLQFPLEGIVLKYRTSGINDNSGSWSTVNANNDLSSIGAPASIQFRIDFKTISSGFCIPARILGLAVVYEDLNTDSHYQPSASFSSSSTKHFAWRFATAFGGTVPTLRIRLYDAETGGLLLDDDTATHTLGTFEKSTDLGVSWGAYDTSDKSNEDTFIRYQPTSIADNIKVRALLTLA